MQRGRRGCQKAVSHARPPIPQKPPLKSLPQHLPSGPGECQAQSQAPLSRPNVTADASSSASGNGSGLPAGCWGCGGTSRKSQKYRGAGGEGRMEGGSRRDPAASGWGCSAGRKALMEVDQCGGVCPLPCITHLGEPLWGFQGDPLFLPVHGGLGVSGDWRGPSPGSDRMGGEAQAHPPSCREERGRASVGSRL